MADLCREFGITRRTGYKYLECYEAEGVDGLKDRSRAPKKQGRATREKKIKMIVNARNEHPTWGPRKLLPSLMGRYPQTKDWPSPATIGRILKREDLIPKKKRRHREPSTSFPLSHVLEPNDVWSTDFKGHFTVGNRERCDPLTISDNYGRFLLDCTAVKKTDTENVQKVFVKVFREFGMPEAIRSDNGAPFAANGLAGLSRLSVWSESSPGNRSRTVDMSECT